MKRLRVLLVSGLLACSQEGYGQAAPSGNRIFTRADTLQALHDLFRATRRRGRVMTALLPVVVGATAYAGSQVEFHIDLFGSGAPDTTSDLPLIGALAGSLGSIALAITGPGTWRRNSKAHEQEIIRWYEQRRPLPMRVQRQLHARLGQLLHYPPPVRVPLKKAGGGVIEAPFPAVGV